jgi:hypothetical protein
MVSRPYTGRQIADLTGLPVNTQYMWFYKSLLPGVGECPGSGSTRRFSFDDVVRIAVIVQLTNGLRIEVSSVAHRILRVVYPTEILAAMNTGTSDHWFVWAYARTGPDTGSGVAAVVTDLAEAPTLGFDVATAMAVVNVSAVIRQVVAALPEVGRA